MNVGCGAAAAQPAGARRWSSTIDRCRPRADSGISDERRKMKIRKLLGFLVFVMAALPAFSQEKDCTGEYERWKREEGGYAELLGVVKGVIYVYSLELKSPEVCLPDGAELRINAISTVLMSESAALAPVAKDFIFTRAEAYRFLKRSFPCVSKPLPQSSR